MSIENAIAEIAPLDNSATSDALGLFISDTVACLDVQR